MFRDHFIKANIRSDVGIGEHHILFLGTAQQWENVGECFYTSAVYLDTSLRKRRDDVQTAFFAGQIPLASASQVIHERAVILAQDDRDIINAGIDHAGKQKVDHAVTAGKGDGSHQAMRYQLRHERVITVGKYDSHCIYV